MQSWINIVGHWNFLLINHVLELVVIHAPNNLIARIDVGKHLLTWLDYVRMQFLLRSELVLTLYRLIWTTSLNNLIWRFWFSLRRNVHRLNKCVNTNKFFDIDVFWTYFLFLLFRAFWCRAFVIIIICILVDFLLQFVVLNSD